MLQKRHRTANSRAQGTAEIDLAAMRREVAESYREYIADVLDPVVKKLHINVRAYAITAVLQKNQ